MQSFLILLIHAVAAFSAEDGGIAAREAELLFEKGLYLLRCLLIHVNRSSAGSAADVHVPGAAIFVRNLVIDAAGRTDSGLSQESVSLEAVHNAVNRALRDGRKTLLNVMRREGGRGILPEEGENEILRMS